MAKLMTLSVIRRGWRGGRSAWIVLGLLLVMAMVLPGLTLGCLAVAGVLAVALAAGQASADRWLQMAALGNLGAGVLISICLYAVSVWYGLALGPLVIKPGFWAFIGGDAVFYHQMGAQIADALRHQTPFPKLDSTYGGSFYLVVGLLYRLFGEHPLVISFFNATLGALTVILSYRIVEPLGGRVGARATALLVAGWPSMLLWSSQVMKDVLAVFLLTSALLLVLPLLDPRPWRRVALRFTGLWLIVFFLCFLRGYLAFGLGTAIAVAVVFSACRGVLRGGRLGRAALAVVVIGAGMLSAQRAGPGFLAAIAMLNPHPTAAYFRAGTAHESAGRWDQAVREYRQAVALKDDFAPAYLSLGLLKARQGAPAQAAQALRRYLALAPHDYSAEANRRLIGVLEAPAMGAPLAEVSAPSAPPATADPNRRQLEREIVSSFHPMTGHWMLKASSSDEVTPGAGKRFIAGNISAQTLGAIRRGFVATGGASVLTSEMPTRTGVLDVVRWIPSAVGAVLFAPYPWQWVDAHGRFIPWRTLAGLESLMVLVLLPGAARGAWHLLRTRSAAGLMLMCLCGILVVGIGVTVVNAGTLFRLRLPALMPFLFLAGIGWSAWLSEHQGWCFLLRMGGA